MTEGILLWSLIFYASAMCFTPGPNVVMITSSAANFGFRRSWPHMLGIAVGFGLLILAVGLGASGLFEAWPQLHQLLKIAGSLYLLYLTWHIAAADAAKPAAGAARPINFVEALLFQWVNPKGWVSAIGAFAAYTTSEGNIFIKTLIVTLVLALVCLAAVAVWAGFGLAIARMLKSARARFIFNGSMAALLLLSLVPVWL